MNLSKKAVFTGVCIAFLSIYYAHERPMRESQAVIISDYRPGKVNWFVCAGDKWCTIADMDGKLGAAGNHPLSYYSTVYAAFVIWNYQSGRPSVLQSSPKKYGMMNNVSDLVSNWIIDHPTADKSTTYISWTEDDVDKYDVPWNETEKYSSFNLPDR